MEIGGNPQPTELPPLLCTVDLNLSTNTTTATSSFSFRLSTSYRNKFCLCCCCECCESVESRINPHVVIRLRLQLIVRQVCIFRITIRSNRVPHSAATFILPTSTDYPQISQRFPTTNLQANVAGLDRSDAERNRTRHWGFRNTRRQTGSKASAYLWQDL